MKTLLEPSIVYTSELLFLLHHEIRNKIKKKISNVIDPDLASRLQSLSHRHNMASLFLLCKYFHGNYCDELSCLLPRQEGFRPATRLVVRSQLYC